MTAGQKLLAPQIQFKPLNRADGSASFRDQLCSILVSVNGPVEVQRRDELPEESAIEVNIRPSAGVGGPRERWLEEVLASVLRSIVLVHLYPRSLVQVTLQMMKEPGTLMKGRSDVGVIPSLVNAAFAGLVDAGLPLRTTAIAALVAIDRDGTLVSDPVEKQLASSRSLHAMAYDKDGILLLDESIGTFDVGAWERVAATIKQLCQSALRVDDTEDLMITDDAERAPWLRQSLTDKIAQANAWRETT